MAILRLKKSIFTSFFYEHRPFFFKCNPPNQNQLFGGKTFFMAFLCKDPVGSEYLVDPTIFTFNLQCKIYKFDQTCGIEFGYPNLYLLKSFPFAIIPGTTNVSLPFPKVGRQFSFPFPFPHIRNAISHSCSQRLGIEFFISIPKILEWAMLIRGWPCGCFLSDPGVPGPIFVSGCPSVRDLL